MQNVPWFIIRPRNVSWETLKTCAFNNEFVMVTQIQDIAMTCGARSAVIANTNMYTILIYASSTQFTHNPFCACHALRPFCYMPIQHPIVVQYNSNTHIKTKHCIRPTPRRITIIFAFVLQISHLPFNDYYLEVYEYVSWSLSVLLVWRFPATAQHTCFLIVLRSALMVR